MNAILTFKGPNRVQTQSKPIPYRNSWLPPPTARDCHVAPLAKTASGDSDESRVTYFDNFAGRFFQDAKKTFFFQNFFKYFCSTSFSRFLFEVFFQSFFSIMLYQGFFSRWGSGRRLFFKSLARPMPPPPALPTETSCRTDLQAPQIPLRPQICCTAKAAPHIGTAHDERQSARAPPPPPTTRTPPPQSLPTNLPPLLISILPKYVVI